MSCEVTCEELQEVLAILESHDHCDDHCDKCCVLRDKVKAILADCDDFGLQASGADEAGILDRLVPKIPPQVWQMLLAYFLKAIEQWLNPPQPEPAPPTA